MAIIKCKMCGGDLEIAAGVTVAECEYCGTKQTLPKANDEVIQNLFNRANNLRIKCEFDKAEQIYEKILQENDAESEAHWGIVLCKYGIEYVEDPKTYKRIPTCHRTSYDAVTTDADYLAAVEHADATQRSIYEAEAKAIDEIQKNILNIVKEEKPFDVFICYKETDESGKRTVDSTIANDIYYQLTQEGLKVFYAAITLEDKLGQEYEPYIFAALNSAKVMLVIGTKPQYFSAVWVKNEWSRFLKLMKADRSKLLIPCYKDMDAYDLPEEFAHLQAQDMSKIGFINDVVRGIKKVTVKDEPKTTVVKETVVTDNANTAPLLKRAFIFLEDGDWNSANEYCEKVLDIDPECAEAYLGKLMVELKVTSRQKLKDCATPFDGENNFQKAMRFGGDTLKKELQGFIDSIVERNLTKAYNDAVLSMKAAQSEAAFKNAAAKFSELKDYKDSKELARKCIEEAEHARLLALYNSAASAMNSAKTEKQFKVAANKFTEIGTFKDAKTLAAECLDRAEMARLTALYDSAISAMNSAKTEQQYKTAAVRFKAIKTFKDAQEQYTACLESAEVSRKDAIYSAGIVLMNNRVKRIDDLQAAIEEFQKIYGWKDADDKIIECQDLIAKINTEEFDQYETACRLMRTAKTQEDFRQAKAAFTAIHSYRDSMEKARECRMREEEFIAKKKHREVLTQEMADLMTERNQLGFFATKRKQEIDERIQAIRMELL